MKARPHRASTMQSYHLMKPAPPTDHKRFDEDQPPITTANYSLSLLCLSFPKEICVSDYLQLPTIAFLGTNNSGQVLDERIGLKSPVEVFTRADGPNKASF
jgi:hypothetical protein